MLNEAKYSVPLAMFQPAFPTTGHSQVASNISLHFSPIGVLFVFVPQSGWQYSSNLIYFVIKMMASTIDYSSVFTVHYGTMGNSQWVAKHMQRLKVSI